MYSETDFFFSHVSQQQTNTRLGKPKLKVKLKVQKQVSWVGTALDSYISTL